MQDYESERSMVPRNTITPAAVLERLYAGNRRFVAGQGSTPLRDPAVLRVLANGQRPLAAILGCADSRVPVEVVFDQGFGDLFVTRVAGNVVTPELIGSLEFGCKVLGAKVLYVLGHTSCGAVTATAAGKEVPGMISALYHHIRPAVKAAGGDIGRAVIENVRMQAGLLAESSPVIADLVRRRHLIVAGGVYDLQTGVVTPVNLNEA